VQQGGLLKVPRTLAVLLEVLALLVELETLLKVEEAGVDQYRQLAVLAVLVVVLAAVEAVAA
jgi:hypothetical protein